MGCRCLRNIVTDNPVLGRDSFGELGVEELGIVLAATNEIHYLYLVSMLNGRLRIGVPLDHLHVVLDGDAARINVEEVEQRGDRNGAAHVERFAVQLYGHSLILRGWE